MKICVLQSLTRPCTAYRLGCWAFQHQFVLWYIQCAKQLASQKSSKTEFSLFIAKSPSTLLLGFGRLIWGLDFAKESFLLLNFSLSGSDEFWLLAWRPLPESNPPANLLVPKELWPILLLAPKCGILALGTELSSPF